MAYDEYTGEHTTLHNTLREYKASILKQKAKTVELVSKVGG
jgi:hypothetical protein